MFTHQAVILLAIFVAALPSFSEWDQRFFPTPDKPSRVDGVFQSDVVISQIVYAVDERIVAAARGSEGWGDDLDIYASQIKKPELVVEEVKKRLLGVMPLFLNHTTTNKLTPTSLVYWDKESMIDYLGLTNDFFEYTPIRNLTGNIDSESKHITDGYYYGWHHIQAIITNLIYTFEGGGFMRRELVDTCTFSAGPFSNDRNDSKIFQESITNYIGFTSAESSLERGNWIFEGGTLEGDYNRREEIGDSGRIACYLLTDWPEKNKIYSDKLSAEATTWYKKDVFIQINCIPCSEDDYAAKSELESICSVRDTGCGSVVPLWEEGSKISLKQVLDDRNLFLFGNTIPFLDTCNVDGIIEVAERYGYCDFDSDSRIDGCFGTTELQPSKKNFALSSARTEYVHIVKWDFVYD